MQLDHTIVPARNKLESARFIARLFDRTVKPGHFAQVQVNESLTLDFADDAAAHSHHLAFATTEEEYEAIFARIRADRVPYGSGPGDRTDGQEYLARGGRGVYFDDPAGNIFEVMTVPETGVEPTDRVAVTR